MCISFIRRHFMRQPVGKLVTTRECLPFGTRSAVDQALSRLVRRGFIVRLARGVFMRDGPGVALPSLFEIASVKARAFAKVIARHGADLAAELALLQAGNPEPTYAVSGHSSSFCVGQTVVHFKGACPRRLPPVESLPMRIMGALWHLGRSDCTPEAVLKSTSECGRTDRQALVSAVSLVPAWLGRLLSPPRQTVGRRSKYAHPDWFANRTALSS